MSISSSNPTRNGSVKNNDMLHNVNEIEEKSLGCLEMSISSSNPTQNGSVKNNDTLHNISQIEESAFSKLLDRPRPLNMERQRSFDERSLADLAIGFSPRLSSRLSSENFTRLIDNYDQTPSPGRRSDFNTPRSQIGFEQHPMVAEAWDALRRSLVHFRGQPVGTIAALDSTEENLNYDQVFVRDFVPSAFAFLMNGEPEIVKNFILKTLRLQSWEKKIDRFQLGEGVMPASFKVLHDPVRNSETLIADFGESAIGRVAPVDSGFWWIILLRAYTKSTGDSSLAELPECQKGMRLILSLCLSEGFDTFPTLLCADGCCMIDRRMGVYGYPIEIQALFFMALRCALLLLKHDHEGKDFIERITKRLLALSYHMRTYFWLDLKQLNDIYRYKTEEYSHTALNKFNVIPDSLPEWIFDFMPIHGGYFIGNVSPARMDFRWFCLGNCIAILSALATPEQSTAIMDLIESRWEELVGEMPLKVCYPAIESHEWRIITGCDPKNTRWSYHNGGSWPVLLWLLTAACIKTGRPQIARRAIELAETRLLKDSWPEYYDGKLGRYIGKQARKFQTWSIAGYLVAKMMLEDPSHAGMVSLEEDKQMKPLMKRSHSWTC
ncbi:probable alkaline/neutral invertase B isoform X1 [Cucurbita moschata]|uniref:Alkaline/neutral invertase n=2 Tax=Cucurbita moschata TaxID=3662 RepID=A0A6J1EKW4_CUCMO|nr:probable alkaline/neutral invertase B isoform X1 [Cucurbita moschata]XP_022928455.1 probable alkaline/neutral invertase B isoform X1 [Cucurbita moschata]